MPDLLYFAAITLAALLVASPALLRHLALRRIEAAMSEFCRAPTRAKASCIEQLLAKHGVHRGELGATLYARWLNVRLAMDRINMFQRSKEA